MREKERKREEKCQRKRKLEQEILIEKDSRTELFEYEQKMLISPPKTVSLSIDTSDDIVADDMNAEEDLLFQYTLNVLLNSVSPLHISPRPRLRISPPRSSDDLVLSPVIFFSS